MARRIMLVLMVAALSFVLCDAMNIFGVEYKDEISVSKLRRRLMEEDPDAKEVARLLAITEKASGGERVFGKVKVGKLLSLAERSDKAPLEKCDAYHFNYHRMVCDSLSRPKGNIRLLDYCNHCYDLQFEFCANEMEELFNYKVRTFEFANQLVEISEKISKWIVRDGDEKKPEEENIRGFIRSRADGYVITKKCARLVKNVEKTLLFFDKDDKKTSKFLAGVQEKEYDSPIRPGMVYKRCAMIDRLANAK